MSTTSKSGGTTASNKRGAKPKPPRGEPRQPLSPTPPRDLAASPRAKAIYKRLAAELAVEGYVCQADWRTVALAARTEAHAEAIELAVSQLTSLVTLTKSGEKIHPLVAELRSVRASLAAIYGSLFLTPRSRSSSRLTADSGRLTGAKPAEDEFDQFMAKGGGANG